LPPRLGEKYGPDATLTIFQTVSGETVRKVLLGTIVASSYEPTQWAQRGAILAAAGPTNYLRSRAHSGYFSDGFYAKFVNEGKRRFILAQGTGTHMMSAPHREEAFKSDGLASRQ
jgi:hypothetical protein